MNGKKKIRSKFAGKILNRIPTKKKIRGKMESSITHLAYYIIVII
jgi:hypothetical protein